MPRSGRTHAHVIRIDERKENEEHLIAQKKITFGDLILRRNDKNHKRNQKQRQKYSLHC